MKTTAIIGAHLHAVGRRHSLTSLGAQAVCRAFQFHKSGKGG